MKGCRQAPSTTLYDVLSVVLSGGMSECLRYYYGIHTRIINTVSLTVRDSPSPEAIAFFLIQKVAL